jgi:hypothetical protein
MGNMKINLGKWEYNLTLKGVKLVGFNVYSNSWVKIIR